MTKKDFQFIADVLSSLRAGIDPKAVGFISTELGQDLAVEFLLDLVTAEFAHRLAANNPKFDQARFIQAASTPANERK